MRENTRPISEPNDGLAATPSEPAETIAEIYDRYAPQVERWAPRLAGPRLDCPDAGAGDVPDAQPF